MGSVGVAMKVFGRVLNDVVSFFVFSALDLLDVLLCMVYKLADYAFESEWKPCYCSSSSAGDRITGGGNILVSERGGPSRVVCLCNSKIQLEDISDTLFDRPSLVSDVCKSTAEELKRLKSSSSSSSLSSSSGKKSRFVLQKSRPALRSSAVTINSTIVEMLQGKIGRLKSTPIPRWSDCDCTTCTSWSSSSSKETLFVHVEGAKENVKEDVLFIHGFISSSKFWTETVFENFRDETKRDYRLIAVDLLGFGRSPKPADSLYTLREHLDMIERSVLEPYNVKSFHIVAHSLGCILALAIAVKYPNSIKSLTLLAPPYFPVPKGEMGTQFVLRRVAPRRVWPLIAFGASVAGWYEHISRTICLVICKNHRIWDFFAKQITRHRVKTFLIEGFMCHTHNAAWHTLHNIICGSAGKIGGYLDTVNERLTCDVTVFHGRDDELLPVECSEAVRSKIPRAHLKVVEKKDHITIVVGRQKAFARELEEIWNNSSKNN
ncbi:hypothetical protein QJS04_geneDACA010799 [Acorus gramineus]|uniref:AB hydrolase-1 domain-containing protein n=1 Tax=Acorus gramineus TaxID=55184 RepID=A0AAV9BAW3_ACOGR|nr:hypothetical protein QJS04_geneDACA010799 [Acorus gramineus]